MLQSLLTAMHVAMWSQLGVLTRIYLDLFFTNGCTGRWGVCLLSHGETRHSFGAYFSDIAPNMMGSFVMGMLAAGVGPGNSVKILPQRHVWQGCSELQVGLRTGFCGSLTTFASWQLFLMQILIGGKSNQGGQWAEFLWGQIVGLYLALASFLVGKHLANDWTVLVYKTGLPSEDKQLPSTASRSEAAVTEHTESSSTASGVFGQHVKTNASCAVLLSMLTILWIVFAIVDNRASHAARRQQWFALLFAPFGALLRWQLSGLNGKVGPLTWVPIGTLAANLLASGIDFGLQGAEQRLHQPSYWLNLLFGAVRVGFSGALSTVSTYVMEVCKLREDVRSWRSTLYCTGSIFLASILGLVVYGSCKWA